MYKTFANFGLSSFCWKDENTRCEIWIIVYNNDIATLELERRNPYGFFGGNQVRKSRIIWSIIAYGLLCLPVFRWGKKCKILPSIWKITARWKPIHTLMQEMQAEVPNKSCYDFRGKLNNSAFFGYFRKKIFGWGNLSQDNTVERSSRIGKNLIDFLMKKIQTVVLKKASLFIKEESYEDKDNGNFRCKEPNALFKSRVTSWQ